MPLVVLAAVAVVLLVPAFAVAQSAVSPTRTFGSVSKVTIDTVSVVIDVPIEVVGGTDAMFARWQRGIDRTWNHGNNGRPFVVCGRAVTFNANFVRRPPDAQVPRNVHVVVIEEVPPGVSYMSRVWHALGTSPVYSSRTGFWGSTTDAATAAHEFGHLLGLFDEYKENDKNANGLREPGERPLPDERRFPDAWLSLMAHESGSVLHRHVRDVVRMHASAAAICP
jgi:hypothetical protein